METVDALPEDYDPVFVITPIGLRRLRLEVKEDSGTIGKKEGRELREIRAGVRKLSEADALRTVIPHLETFAATQAAMRKLATLERAVPAKRWHRRRRDPRFLAF